MNPTQQLIEKQIGEDLERKLGLLVDKTVISKSYDISPYLELFYEFGEAVAQGARDSVIATVKKVMDKDEAKKLGDNIEIYGQGRSCKLCGCNPEWQREYLLSKLESPHPEGERCPLMICIHGKGESNGKE